MIGRCKAGDGPGLKVGGGFITLLEAMGGAFGAGLGAGGRGGVHL